jgi:hypothetical protein
VIALSGRARRNADRELARVLAFLDYRISIAREAGALPGATDADAKIAEWLAQRLLNVRADLERLRHRTP